MRTRPDMTPDQEHEFNARPENQKPQGPPVHRRGRMSVPVPVRVRLPSSRPRPNRRVQSELAERSRTNRFSIAQLEAGETTKAVEKLFDTLAALDLELVVRHRRGWKAK